MSLAIVLLFSILTKYGHNMQSSKSPSVSIIIPAWKSNSKNEQGLEELLSSIKSSVSLDYEVILVCNSQNEDLIQTVKDNPVISKYCLNSVNVGVSRGWNIGVQLAESEFLCFINDDVTLGKDTISTLYDTLINKIDVGIVGVEGVILDPKNIFVVNTRINNGRPRYCDVVSGYLFMVRRSLYKQLGGFDNDLSPCFFEEIDFCLRAKAQGMNCYILPNLPYNHPWGVSTSNGTREINYLKSSETLSDIYRRNKLVILRKKSQGIYGDLKIKRENYGPDYYNDDYFKGYAEVMEKDHIINGVIEQPLSKTMVDMVDALGKSFQGKKVLDLACSYGFFTRELIARNYDAYGIDFSYSCLQNSPIKNHVICADVSNWPFSCNFDLIIAANLFEHLNLSQIYNVASNIFSRGKIFLSVINKGSHDPSHISILPNWKWIMILKQYGLVYSPGLTNDVRQVYKKKSQGTEKWDRDALVFNVQKNNIVGCPYYLGLFYEYIIFLRDTIYSALIHFVKKLLSFLYHTKKSVIHLLS